MPGLSGLGVPDRAQQSRGRETHDKYQACVKRHQQGRTQQGLQYLYSVSLTRWRSSALRGARKGYPGFAHRNIL